MDKFFPLHMHHGEYFDENPQKYVGAEVEAVKDCDLDKWSKVEIEAICRDFGYTHMSWLWYRRPGDDHDAVLMTELVRGHREIHVYVEHLVHEPILINNGNGVPLDLVVEPDYDDPLFVNDSEIFSSYQLECPFDGYYNGKGYYYSSGSNFEDDDDWDDGDDHWDGDSADGRADGKVGGSANGRDGGKDGGGGMGGGRDEEFYDGGDESGSGGARDEGDRNDDSDDEVETLRCRRPGKEPIIKEPQQDEAVTTNNNDSSRDSDVEGARSMSPNWRYMGEDSASSDSEVVMHMHNQMGDMVMNSNYTTEELLSLSESSSDGEVQGDGDDGSDSEGGATVNERVVNNVKRRRKKFLVFRPVSYPEHLEDELAAEYSELGAHMHQELQKHKVFGQVPAKKLMKKVKRQPNIKLRDIQEVVHEKYVVNISAGKASKAREKAQEFVDGSYIEKYNQLWDYCVELRRSSLGSIVLMKTHTFNEGDLAVEMDLQAGLPYFESSTFVGLGVNKGSG
ncbi:hypothetical protein SO802_019378 [Lithocarpus litseifolius]|uniref:PB1-like domain-containing protein n=1 Tax=Lithocarpus litseifolius TaxID=425828 RepID=A0AAW2CRZ2_9ROSI